MEIWRGLPCQAAEDSAFRTDASTTLIADPAGLTFQNCGHGHAEHTLRQGSNRRNGALREICNFPALFNRSPTTQFCVLGRKPHGVSHGEDTAIPPFHMPRRSKSIQWADYLRHARSSGLAACADSAMLQRATSDGQVSAARHPLPLPASRTSSTGIDSNQWSERQPTRRTPRPIMPASIGRGAESVRIWCTESKRNPPLGQPDSPAFFLTEELFRTVPETSRARGAAEASSGTSARIHRRPSSCAWLIVQRELAPAPRPPLSQYRPKQRPRGVVLQEPRLTIRSRSPTALADVDGVPPSARTTPSAR